MLNYRAGIETSVLMTFYASFAFVQLKAEAFTLVSRGPNNRQVSRITKEYSLIKHVAPTSDTQFALYASSRAKPSYDVR